MAIKPKYLVEALESGNIMTVGEALMRYHAPSIKMKATLGRKQSHYLYEEKEIQWAVIDGLSTLLHELGHHACKHRKLRCCDGKAIEEESEAWLWAEKWAVKHGIRFDYLMADKAFGFIQAGRPKVIINWSHRHFFGNLEVIDEDKYVEKVK